MSYLKQLVDARQQHLECLADQRQSGRADLDCFETELLLRLVGETPLIGNFYVFDIAGIDGSRVCVRRATSRTIKVGESVQSAMGKRLRVDGLCWDAITFKLAAGTLPMERLTEWFERWIGAAFTEANVPASLPAIHDLLAPYAEATGARALLKKLPWPKSKAGIEVGCLEAGQKFRGSIHAAVLRSGRELVVDFGSAPIRAYSELLAILEQSEAEEIVIRPAPDGRAPFDLVLELAQRQMEQATRPNPATAAAEFWAWFAANAAPLTAKLEEMRQSGSEDFNAGIEQLGALRDAVGERLERIEGGLGAEFRNVDEGPALIITARGDPNRMAVVRDLVARAPAIPGWQIIAFQPPSPVIFGVEFEVPGYGTVGFNPETIMVALRPRLSQIDIALHFKDADAVQCLMLQETTEQAVFCEVGELVYLEAVGQVTAEPLPADSAGTLPFISLNAAFAALADERRSILTGLRSLPAAERLESNLSLLADRVAAFRRVLVEFGAIEEVRIRFDFWAPQHQTLEILEDALPEFKVIENEEPSLAGLGWRLTAVGTCPVQADGLQAWLRQVAEPLLEAEAILVDVSELELYQLDMVEELDQKATELLDEGRWAEAGQIMRHLTARIGEVEQGRMHAKTGRCYYRGEQYERALAYYGQALERLVEEDWIGEAHTNSGACFQHLGRIELAVEHYRQALALDEQNAQRQYNLGQALAIVCDAQRACDHLRRAAELDRDQARKLTEDPDLEPIRHSPPFLALVRDLAA